MAQGNITIEFKPKGDRELIAAIKQLDIATKRLNGTVSVYEKEVKSAERAQKKFSVSSIFATKSLRNMGGATLGVTRIISRFRSKLLLASFALGGFNFLVKQRVDMYREQLQAEKALISNLNNVSSASKNGASSLIEYAAALQRVTTFGDEQIIQAAAQLATFQLNEKAISTILPRLLDMSASQGTLEGNAIALGKAFTGQIGTLSRYGVIIDKAQLAIARAEGSFEEFNFIIKELDKNYKGLAKALAETEIGKLDQLENEISDLNEQLGKLGLPFLKQWTGLKKSLTEMATWIAIIMDELQKRSGSSWVMGLLDSVLIFGDIAKVFEKANKVFEKHIETVNKSSVSQDGNNVVVSTGADILKKYNQELALNISNIQLTENQTDGLNKTEAKSEIIKAKILMIQKQYNEGLITFNDFVIKQNALIIENNNLEESIHQQKIARSFELASAISDLADQYIAAEQAQLNSAKATEIEAANSIRSERRRQREIDKINKKYAAEQEEINKKSKRAKRTQTVINTATGIMEVWADKETGTFAKIAMSALVAALGDAQLKTIDATKYEQGGLVGGRRHSQGGTMIEAERGEYVVSRRGVEAAGIEALNRINAGAGGGGVNITFQGNVMSKDFIEDEAIPQIKEAIRRGADIGVG